MNSSTRQIVGLEKRPRSPDVFGYTDYRAFLQDYYDWSKKHRRGFSHRSFLAEAGMSGPNYLKKVMEGVHNLTSESITKFSKALKLDAAGEAYFRNLVQFNQAKTLEEKDHWFGILMQARSPFQPRMLEPRQYEYYKNWYHVAIREVLSFLECGSNIEDLSKELMPSLTPKKARQALELLQELGLVDFKNGKWHQTDRALTTGPEVKSLFVPVFHKEMARLGIEAISTYSREERNYSGVTMSISEESYADIVDILTDARSRIAEEVDREERPTRVYQLNLQLFPLSRTKPIQKRRRRKP